MTDKQNKRDAVLKAAVIWVYDQSCANALMDLEDAVTDLIGIPLDEDRAVSNAIKQISEKVTLTGDELNNILKNEKPKPIRSAFTFMYNNISDPVVRMGTRPNGATFYHTRTGRLYELNEMAMAVLASSNFKIRFAPEFTGQEDHG